MCCARAHITRNLERGVLLRCCREIPERRSCAVCWVYVCFLICELGIVIRGIGFYLRALIGGCWVE